MRRFQSLSLGKRYLVAGLVALLILALIVGFYGLEQTLFAPANSLAGTSSPTPVTMTGSPTAGLSPTAMPSPTAAPSPTATPSPTAKPSPAILTVSPRTYYFNHCTPSGRASYYCTFTLRNSSTTSPLAWTAKASNSHGMDATKYLSSTSGTLPKRGSTTVSLYLNGETGVCTLVGTTVYLQFTGPKNTVTVTVTC